MRYLALLPVQRLTDGLSSMDNPLGTGSAGGARAEGVVEMEMDTSVDCADPHFLTHTEPRGPLPGPWRPTVLRLQPTLGVVERLYVPADGACAAGAFVLARSDPSAGTLSLSHARNPRIVEAFRTKDIVAHLRGWTGLEWEARIPQSLRDDLWADRPPCTSSACRDKSPTGCWCPRTPIAERDLLCSQCATPRFAVGPIFFHVAAIVAQLGVLLLVQDQRHSRHTQYSVYDFGTKAYPFSMK